MMFVRSAWHCIKMLALTALLAACAGHAGEGNNASEPTVAETHVGGDENLQCPPQQEAPRPLPGIEEGERQLSYWLARNEADLDRVLMSPEAIAAHNAATGDDPDHGLPTARALIGRPLSEARLQREVTTRLDYMRTKLNDGEYVDREGRPLRAPAVQEFEPHPIDSRQELRIALASIPLRCGPRREGLYRTPIDLQFDRNNCSTIRAQEAVQVLQSWPGPMQLVRTRYSLGWIPDDAPLSPVLDAETQTQWLQTPRVEIPAGTTLTLDSGARTTLTDIAMLPLHSEDPSKVWWASESGLVAAARLDNAAVSNRPLTRRAMLTTAFQFLDDPYGWGGQDGGRDCSRFLMDTFRTFGLDLPRHSARQAATGPFVIDLSEVDDLAERRRLIAAAHHAGVVLLHFPGHIMLYLGENDAGEPRIMHSFAEYAETCESSNGEDNDETLRSVHRVSISGLELGEGTSRRSFLERIDKIVVLSQTIGPALIGVADARSPTLPEYDGIHCDDSLQVRVFRSPARPNPDQPLRVMVTSLEEQGPATLSLLDPRGRPVNVETHQLGGPPFTYWAEIPSPRPGVWRVLLGDGPRVAACETIRVARHAPTPPEVSPERIWEPRWRWEADTEALFSAFVEQLFNFPIEEDRTWSNLHSLLQDPNQNLLFNHLSQSEEERILLQPDCADLPYFLRTYFSWKLRLPFGFRSCTRGRGGRLPVCRELRTPEMPHDFTDEVDAFYRFIRTQVKRAVHSASGRTGPEDSETPLYPVPLTREALRPGTVFADPYGHLLVVARWIPQGLNEYGILVGADAQPDGTVGRRRFWQGSFLFTPDTTHVGPGFKAWRPVVYDRREELYTSLPNEEITASHGYTPFSMQQYEGTTDDFYDAMASLINPRALDAVTVQLALVDALQESVARRVVSVDNGEQWVAQHPGRTMEMPEGSAIFQTGGPWEDFATPSRDMRLLIALDTVVRFPEAVRRSPARFGLRESEIEEAVNRVRARQQSELEQREFTYTRSDGESQTLSLADVAARARHFEMAYNPNDCVEIRWAAPPESTEMNTCRRHAPGFQRARMRSYRSWFSERRRPLH